MSESYLQNVDQVEFSLEPYDDLSTYDYDAIIFDLDNQLDLLSSHADGADYFVAISSGIVSSLLDVLWFGEFDLREGREIASEQVDSFVMKSAQFCDDNHKKPKDLDAAVRKLEKTYKIPNDANTEKYGGGKQHHLRDFEHHFSIVGLAFSILTQFTKISYGTDKNGHFHPYPVPTESLDLIGDTIPQEIYNGTIVWFFHLVSDMAGSSNTAMHSGGTGIPGPILSLAKEFSTLPFIRDISINDTSLSVFLSKLFNGTLLAEHDENGHIISGTELRFDLRGELGLGIEVGKMSLPVIANEVIVRSFYFLRRLAMGMRDQKVKSLDDFRKLDWEDILPLSNPTLSDMLTVATGVFTSIDIAGALKSKKFLAEINYIGVGRFAVAIGEDITWGLKRRDLKKIKAMYEKIQKNTYRLADIQVDGFGLTEQQTEILYNMEYFKTLHDINTTNLLPNQESVRKLKKKWLSEWKTYMKKGFSSFLQAPDAELEWYSKSALMQKIEACDPDQPWFRLALLEAMLFEPYYPLRLEKDKNGKELPCKEYRSLSRPGNGFNTSDGDQFLDSTFCGKYCEKGYVKRLRSSYNRCINEINETLKKKLQSLSVSAIAMVAVAATAGAFAPAIATTLVGSTFAGLKGVALTNACLAYLGGGAIAAGGAGMAGGTMTIVGGGAVIGAGIGRTVGGKVDDTDVAREEKTIVQSAKLLVSLKEIYLKDERNVEFVQNVYEQYQNNITAIYQEINENQLRADVSKGKEKRELQRQIKEAEKTLNAMRIARRSMAKLLADSWDEKEDKIQMGREFIVQSAEKCGENNEKTIHVLEQSKDYHFHCDYLIGEDGQTYNFSLFETRPLGGNRYQFVLELTDQSMELPEGTVLYAPPEPWRQEIPNSQILELQYRLKRVGPSMDNDSPDLVEAVRQQEIKIYNTGLIQFTQMKTCFDEQESKTLKIAPSRVKKFMKKMLSCVSDDDSYPEVLIDDTEREFSFLFEDGILCEYSDVFFNKTTNTREVMEGFLTEVLKEE